jgi:hypothetical protein
MKKPKTWLILPLVAFSINEDKSKEITLGWLSFTYSIIF